MLVLWACCSIAYHNQHWWLGLEPPKRWLQATVKQRCKSPVTEGVTSVKITVIFFCRLPLFKEKIPSLCLERRLSGMLWQREQDKLGPESVAKICLCSYVSLWHVSPLSSHLSPRAVLGAMWFIVINQPMQNWLWKNTLPPGLPVPPLLLFLPNRGDLGCNHPGPITGIQKPSTREQNPSLQI